MTKKEIIIKSYGKHWEKVKDAVDDNGWCMGFYDIRDIDKKSNWMSNNPTYAHLWQPRALKGIETNSKWNDRIDITKAEFRDDANPIDPTCLCFTCKNQRAN